MLFYYWGVSGGKKMKKWKLRLIKTKYIEPEGAARHDWIAFSSEWSSESRTYVGSFVKKWYLDELPQLINIILGDMNWVGPRANDPRIVNKYFEKASVIILSKQL